MQVTAVILFIALMTTLAGACIYTLNTTSKSESQLIQTLTIGLVSITSAWLIINQLPFHLLSWLTSWTVLSLVCICYASDFQDNKHRLIQCTITVVIVATITVMFLTATPTEVVS